MPVPVPPRAGRGVGAFPPRPLALAVVAALAFLPPPLAPAAFAQETRLVGTFQAWRAYTFTENGTKVCYVASSPTKEEGDYTRRGPVFVLVTHRPADGTKNVVSMVAGYTYREGEPVTVRIGDESFRLYTEEERAWATDASIDQALVFAMQRGRRMVVEGVSWRGTRTTDTYSLSGFTRAHREIGRLCDKG